MLRRLFPSRWARIVAWTGAAVAWATSIVTVQAATEQSATAAPEPLPEPEPEVQEVPETLAPVPAQPERGLVVIRYTPVPPPPPAVMTRTVTVSSGGGGGGGGTAGRADGGGSRPTIHEVVSSGS